LGIEGCKVVKVGAAGVGGDKRKGVFRRKACGVAVEAGQDAAALVIKEIRTKRKDLADLHRKQAEALDVLDVRLGICVDCAKEPEETEDVHLAGRLQFRSRTGAIVFVEETFNVTE
jgi:hypothetical protein